MFSRSTLLVWIGIVILSGMFLMGQDTWGPQPSQPCLTDYDGDGYGASADPSCPSRLDCDDNDRYVYPNAFEFCNDGIDNQCPGDEGFGLTDDNCEAPIPTGCFDMGDHFGEGDSNELPVHNVCISAFEMDVHEVTNGEYARCVEDGGCTLPLYFHSTTRNSYYRNPAYDDFPVMYVSWFDAANYCTWANKRLPSESEWEYAARGGLAGNRYPWGDTISRSDANYVYSGDPWDDDTSPVEYYAANGYGLYDVAGNLREWVEDDYHGSYDCDANPSASYCGGGGVAPTDGSAWVEDPRNEWPVQRGGSWGEGPENLRVATRDRSNQSYGDVITGFRCAR